MEEMLGVSVIVIVAVASFYFGKTVVELYFYLLDDLKESRKRKRQMLAWKRWEEV